MANDKKVNIGIGFNVDRSGLNNLKSELNSLQNMTTDDLVKIGSENAVRDLQEIKNAASAVQEALEKSFNPKLNTQDLTKFQQELKLSGQSIASIRAGLDKAGASGQAAFRNITAELLTTNRQMKQTSQWLNKMADTMANSVRWTIASTALNTITGSVQKAYSFTKQLDSSLNDIRIVTGKSADEMARFAKEATTAAKNLGSTTTAYTKAALIYEQQGLGAADVAARSDVTTKVSNVTGQNADEVSEQLTAIWNGYKVSAAEAELYIDKVSAVAATTAADLEELSQGMGKVASAANAMGVDIDQLNASLATIISVTRQDANAVGTSLKTIYARMGDLMVDGEDEFGVKLGDVSSKLKTMGIDVLDAQGQMRDMGEVIEEVAGKWDTWTEAQQQAAAVALAGKRQYNNLIALFENWDMYEEAKSTSKGGAGELQKQQDIYMESMEAHLNQLKTETEDLYQTLLDPEGLNPMIDALTTLVGLVNNMIQSLGGGAGLLNTLGAIGLNVFSKQITKGIGSVVQNISGLRDNLKQAAAEANIIQELELSNVTNSEEQQKILAIAKERLKIAESMTEEEYNVTNQVMKQANAAFDQKSKLEQQRDELARIIKAHTGIEVKINDVTGEIEEAEEAFKDLKHASEETLNMDISTGELALQEMEDFYTLQEQIDSKTRSAGARKGNITKLQNESGDLANEINSQVAGGIDFSDSDAIDSYYNAVAAQAENTEKLKAAQDKLKQSAEELEDAQDALAQKNEEMHDGIVALIDALKDQSKQTSFTEQEQEELKNITKAVTSVFDENGKVIEGISGGAMKKAIDAIKKYNQMLNKQKTAVAEAIKNGKKFNENMTAAGRAANEAHDKLNKLKQSFDLTKSIQNVTSLVGGVANLLTSLNSLKNIGSIINDETLTNGEKATQLITIAATALPMLISGLQTTKTALMGLTAPITAKALAISLDTLATEKNTDAAKENAIWTKAVEFAKDSLTKEEYEAAMAVLLEGKAIDENTKKKIGSIIGDKAKILSLKGIKEAALGAAAGIKAATTAFLSSPIGWIVLAVTAAIAAIAAIIHLVNAYTVTEEEAFSNAKKRAEELTNALEDTKKAYQDLKTNIENYKNARNSLDELTEGTTEWKEALADANSQALALLQTYPELAKYVNKNEKGLITIDEKGLAELADKQLDQIYKAQSAALIGNAIMRDTKSNLDTTKNAKSFDVDKKTLDAILALDSETILNPDKFANSLKSADIDIKDEKLIESLNDNREEIFALKQTVENTNNLLAIENGEIISGFLQRYGYGSDSGILGGIITSNIIAEGTQKEDIDKLKSNIGISKESFEAWAYAMGIEADESSFKNDAWNAQVKYTIDGEQKTISYDQLKKELANWQYYYQNTQQYLSTATKLLEQVGKTTTKETNDIIRSVFASNQAATKDSIEDFTYETVQEIETILKQYSSSLTESQKLNLLTTQKNLHTSLLNMGAERSWFSTATDNDIIQSTLLSIFDASDSSWEALVQNSDFNYALLSSAGDALSRIARMEGEQSLTIITDFLATYVKDSKQFLEEIDWSSDTLSQDIVNIIYEMGDSIDFTNPIVTKAITYFSQLSGVLETNAERARKTKDIINNLNYGDIISKEDFEYLRANYANLINSYFVQMEDGTAILTASAWEFYEAYHKIDMAKREAALEAAKTEYDSFKPNKGQFLSDSESEKIVVATPVSREAERQDYINNTTSIDYGGTLRYAKFDRAGKIVSAYDNSVIHPLDVLGVGSSILTEQQMLPMVKEWLSTEGASSERAAVLKRLNKTSLDQLTADEWDKIILGEGLAEELYRGTPGQDQLNLRLNSDNQKATMVKVSDMITDILTDRANRYFKDSAIYSVDKEAVAELILDAKTKGYISEDDFEMLNKALEDPKNLEATSSEWTSSKIYSLFKGAIDKNEGSTDKIKQEIKGILSAARTEEEYEYYLEKYKNEYAEIFNGTEWAEIENETAAIAAITIEQTAIKKYETSISNIDEAYNNLGQTLETLEKQLDKAFGEERIEILEDMNDVLDRQNTLLEAQKQLAQAEVTRRFQDGEGVVQDALKFIAKGEEISYEALLMRGGIADGTLDTTEEYETLIASLIEANATGEYTDAINTIITSLGPLFDQIYGYSSSIEENLAEEKENALAIFDYTYQTAKDINKIKKSYNDFLKEFSTDEGDFLKQGQLIADDFAATKNNLDTSLERIRALSSIQANADGLYEIEGKLFTQEEIRAELLKEYESYQEYALDLKEELLSFQEMEINQINDIAEQYDTITESIESINELLEHQASIQALIYGENSQAVRDLNKLQADNLSSILETQTQAYNDWLGKIKEVQGRQEEGVAMTDHDKQLLDEYTQRAIEAGKTVAATSAEYAAMLSENYQANIEATFDTLFDGLDKAKEQYDWISSRAETQFDALSGAMEIQKIATSWTKAMYDNKNLKAQSQMNTFIEQELEFLREKDKLTQYDLDRAQARFDLLQAQIALEEAQANKTSMRLVRGADGTYGYQYVADTNEIMEKQQAVLDANQAVMDLDKDEVKNHFDEVYDIISDFVDKYKEVWADGKLEDVERETIQSMWDAIVEEVGDTNGLVENLKESMQAAATAAGLTSFEELSPEEMATLFPEIDTRYYQLLMDLATGDKQLTKDMFTEFVTGSEGAAAAFLRTLGVLDEDLSKIMQGTDEQSGLSILLNGISDEATNKILAGNDALEKLDKTGQDLQKTFDEVASSINSVVTALQGLAIDTSGNYADNFDNISGKPKDSSISINKVVEKALATSTSAAEAAGTVARELKIWVSNALNPIIQAVSMDTDGYTGEWGSWGKEAILHEKELVLNKVDTQNILQSVSIVRDISGYISALSAALDGNLGRTMANITEQNQPVQNVEIHAEFPNATDKNSIKEAFEEILAEAEQMLYENTR